MATETRPRSVPLRIAPFAVIIFLCYLAVGLPLTTIPLYVHNTLGFSDLTVGITVAAESVVTLLTRPFAGTLCDRAGPKRDLGRRQPNCERCDGLHAALEFGHVFVSCRRSMGYRREMESLC